MFHNINTITLGGLYPIGQDSKGLKWLMDDVHKVVINNIKQNLFFKGRVKTMSKDIQEASDLIGEFTQMLDSSLQKMQKTEQNIAEQSKKVSGSVRKSAHDLMTGMASIEKMANFDKLERYVILLERTASAMSVLSDLEKAGKLEKLMSVMKA